MGVPKFFRYISERYPCLSEIVREYQIPEFDNLYLDMNGIIHVCSHPNDFDPHFRISEEDIFKDIFNYIETLFRMIQPKKLFFLAVDGVAPRAKMNQQRGRRFKSAKEAEQLEKEALSKGETLPDVERFDSNCITPGTAFMARLQTELKSFITYKINTDKIWRNPTVILSGHETPGEGEHKIMDYIRFLKSKPNYDNNTRHCLYGLDADLIMLGLCTHEPHFSLLREEVKFSKNAQKKRSNAPDEITFFLLHLSLMREYIGLEFQELKKTVKFGFNLEKIIDDWVLMGFLVGNDFIPHLPHLHIANGALPILYQAYIDVLPTLDGHINEDGTLNLLRFQKYMERLSNFDYNQFKDHLVDLKYFEEKTGRKAFRPGETMNDGSGSQKKNSELEALIKETDEFLAEEGIYYSDSSDEDYEDSSLMRAEFQQHKSDYYKNKMEYSEVTKNVLQSQAECYVRAIQWNLNYYYNGCCSWSWFYPHHYAPYMSDIRNFADFKLDFDLGEPFYPFQQLLAVLPAGSKKLLPEPFQELMTDEDSPIIDFYPIDFETDMNGKKQHWEAVVLIPFIDEKKLLKAMESRYDRLTDEEKRRNCHGPMHVFNYTPEDLGSCELPEYFSQVKNNHVEVTTMYREDIYVDKRKLVRGLCKGVKLDTYYPGFPTLKHLKFKGRLEKAGVRVFEQPSQGENMILTLEPKDFHNVKKLANILLDQIVHVRWPHLREARVRAISDGENHYSVSNVSSEKKELVIEKLNSERQELWKAESRTIAMDYKGKLGVKVGETNIIIYATFLEGKKYLYLPNGKVTLKKQWEQVPTPFAFQTVVVNLKVEEDVKGRELTIGDVFKPGGFCFLLVTKFYGDMGLIDSEQCDGKIKLTICNISEPDFKTAKSIAQQLKGLYVTGNVLANKLGVSSHLLSRITGSIFVSKDDSGEPRSRVNVGLNLKFNKRNEEVSGYTKRLQNGMWLYSPKAEELLRGYLDVASDLIRNLSSVVGNDVFTLEDVFPENGEKRLSEISKWLKESTSKLMRQKCGSEVLDEDVIKALEKTIDFLSPAKKTFVIQCKPQFLVLPIVSLGRQCPDPGAEHRLFDRVRSIRESYIVPTGMKGTIIGIHRAEKECDTSYDILYDEVFPGGLSLNGSAKRCCRALKQSFINLSHGQRMANAKQQQSHTQNQETSYRYTNSDARNGPGRNSSAFVSCQDSKEYNKKDEESPFLDALLKKNKSTPKDNQVKLPNKAPQNETQNLNNQSKLEDRLTRNKPQNADPPSDQLRKVLKISDKTPQQVSSSNKPLLDNPPSIPNHADYSCSRELNELCFRNGWRFNTDWHKVHSGFNVEITVSTLNNILAKNSSKGRTAEEALERACYIVLESIKSNFHLQVPYNIFPQQNFNWPSFYPGHQMIPSIRGYPPFRMNTHGGAHTQSSYAIPPPPFQWWCAGDQQTHQRGRRGAGRGAYYANSMPNTSHDNARSQHWEQVDMQPSRWQQENVTRNASYQSDRGQTQSPQNQYQFSQSWSAEQNQIGNPMNHDNSRNISSQRSTNYSTSNQSNQPLTTQQDQTDRMKMQNAPMHHSSHRSTSRPESSNKKREWKLACSFKNAPELD